VSFDLPKVDKKYQYSKKNLDDFNGIETPKQKSVRQAFTGANWKPQLGRARKQGHRKKKENKEVRPC
jgi:hypothetical protein